MNFFKKILYLDLRSLAILRIGLGLLLIVNALQLLTDVQAFLSDSGIYPRIAQITSDMHRWTWSLNMINGTTAFQALLLFASLVFGFLFLIGYKTKFSGAMSWALLVSLVVKNPMIVQGGDLEIVIILFWSLFLPIDRKWSFDSYKFDLEEDAHHFSASGVCYFIQIAMVYVFAGLLKNSPEWVIDGTAIHMAFHLDMFATPLAKWLLQFPDLLVIMSKSVLYWEVFCPLLLILPVISEYSRIIFVFSVILFHLGIALTLAIGNFPFICMIAVLGLLPSLFWQILLPNTKSFQFKTSIHGAKLGLQLTCVALITYAFLWNLDELPGRERILNSTLRGVGPLVKIDQKWDMFSPFPFTDDGWYVISGSLEDGTPVDVYNMKTEPASLDKPNNVMQSFSNFRWRKYLNNFYLNRYHEKRVFYARFLCNKWSEKMRTPSRLMGFQIYYMLERSRTDGPPEDVKEVLLYKHLCSY